jgi:hypothetical protein
MFSWSFTWAAKWAVQSPRRRAPGTHSVGKRLKRRRMVGISGIPFFWSLYSSPSDPTLHGKAVLQDLVHSNQDEYSKLSKQEHLDLIEEFEKQKATQTKAFRVSTKGRINDATHTLAAVESEVCQTF